MKVKRIGMALGIWLWGSSQVLAGEPLPSVKALFLAEHPLGQFNTITDRDALVSAALIYCHDIDVAFPRNSPAEDAWLSQEIKQSEERMWRALASPEWGRRKAANFVLECGAWGKIYREKRGDSLALMNLGYSFSKFFEDADSTAEKNRLDPKIYGFRINRSSEAFFLAAMKQLVDERGEENKNHKKPATR